MFKYIIWAIVIYCLVRFIFNFLIPLMRGAKQMKRQMQDFQDRMGQQPQFQGNVHDQQTQTQTQPQQRPAPKPKSEDYIDFEEVK